MKSITAIAAVAALALLGADRSAGAACPSGPALAKLQKTIVARAKAASGKAAPVDQFTVLPGRDAKAPCIAVLALRDRGDCHACGTVVSLHELSRVRGAWRSTFDQFAAFEVGAFGRSPKAVRVPGPVPLLRFDLDDMHQGIQTTSLTLVAKVGGKYAPVLNLLVAEGNAGTGEDDSYAWKAEPRFKPGTGPLPDIEFAYTGTQFGDTGKHEPLDRAETWVFDGARYELRK